MKSLKFRKDLTELVQKGKKTSTWRLFDDKDLSVDDKIELIVWESGNKFASGIITRIVEKPLGKLTKEDKKGHETFSSDKEMYKTYSKYYNQKVGPETEIKIIWFKLLE